MAVQEYIDGHSGRAEYSRPDMYSTSPDATRWNEARAISPAYGSGRTGKKVKNASMIKYTKKIASFNPFEVLRGGFMQEIENLLGAA